MSLHRYAAKRDANESAIEDALRGIGASVYPISSKGVLDLLVGWRGTTYLLEIKGAKGKLTPAQVDFLDSWQGGVAVVVRDVDEALKVIGAIE